MQIIANTLTGIIINTISINENKIKYDRPEKPWLALILPVFEMSENFVQAKNYGTKPWSPS